MLSFWASYDAASRVKNAKLNHLAGNDARIKIISISFDRYESVYRAAIEQDGNDAGNCYWEMEGENSDIYKSYGLKNGFTNYLVDNEGVIVAKDVTADMLASLLD